VWVPAVFWGQRTTDILVSYRYEVELYLVIVETNLFYYQVVDFELIHIVRKILYSEQRYKVKYILNSFEEISENYKDHLP